MSTRDRVRIFVGDYLNWRTLAAFKVDLFLMAWILFWVWCFYHGVYAFGRIVGELVGR